ncbi:hypothetical protein ACLB1G_00410 [Oxalobacteraceae bacterium A2-2]
MENHQYLRCDDAMAEIVDQGISLDRKTGAANAWIFMSSAKVPLPVIKRVLASPEQRRRKQPKV